MTRRPPQKDLGVSALRRRMTATGTVLYLVLLTGSCVVARAAAPEAGQPTPSSTQRGAAGSIWTRLIPHPGTFHDVSVHRLYGASDGSVFVSTQVSAASARLTHVDGAGDVVWSVERAALAGLAYPDPGTLLLGGNPLRVIDRRTGELLWEAKTTGQAEGVALGPDGSLLLLVTEGGDFVVHRWSPRRDVLPSWRLPAGTSGLVQADAIVAHPDGGAVISGRGDHIGGGYVMARFGPRGELLFRHTATGDIGNPLGPSLLLLDRHQNVVVAGSPESAFGVARATIWRLSPTGVLLSSWQTLPDHLLAWNRAARLVPTENGDVLLLVSEVCAHRLLRIDLSSGAIVWNSGELAGNPVGFARDADGRSMVSASLSGCGPAGPTRIVEIDARGVQCRTLHRNDLHEIALASGPQGWLLGGVTPFTASLGNDAMVESWNAGAACAADAIFVDGFEERKFSRSP